MRMITLAPFVSLTLKRRAKTNKGGTEGKGGGKDRRKEKGRRKKIRKEIGINELGIQFCVTLMSVH